MNKTQVLAASAAAAIALASPTVFAQEENTQEFRPVETFTCSYNEGKGPKDLEAAIETWSAYMDENDSDQYFAMTLTPQYYGDDTFNVGWLGASLTGESLGQGKDGYIAAGGKAAAAFAEVLTCESHTLFASMQIKEPPERETPEAIVLTFADCELEDDHTFEELFAAMDTYAAYQAEQSYGNGTWAFFPAYGSGDQDYDFKLVNAYDNHEGLGKAFDLYTTGRGFMKRRELLGELLECDTSRGYDGTVRRTIIDSE